MNVYPEIGEESANPISMVGLHGTTLHAALGAPIRGLWQAWDRFYAVAGNGVYRISGGVATLLGTVANDGLPVSMSHNIFELLIVSSGQGWVVQKATDALTKVSDPEFPDALIADFIDGYGIMAEKESGRFWYTTIDDFETISGIDFATAEGSPDDLVSLIVDHREIFLFGKKTTERWYNAGGASNVFQRSQGGFIEKGCRGTFSPAKLDNTVFWLGNDNVVYRLNEASPVRVSNHGIEKLIRGTTSDPVSYAYNWGGHAFYVLNFPGELSIAFDVATNRWHTRETYGRDDCVYHHHAQVGLTHYVGGADGNVYTISDDVYTHNGGVLPRIRSVGPFRTDQYYADMPELTLVFETGENSDYVNASEVFIEISDDAGKTFSNRIQASLGVQGEYRTEVKFLALGGFHDNQRVIQTTMTDDSRYTLVGAWV